MSSRCVKQIALPGSSVQYQREEENARDVDSQAELIMVLRPRIIHGCVRNCILQAHFLGGKIFSQLCGQRFQCMIFWSKL